MFGVGHLALGYLFGKGSAKSLKTRLNIQLALTLSVLPDVDLLFPFVQHRGPLHSFLVALVVFVPFFVFFRRAAVPYFVALAQHSIVGDFIGGGKVQLLWPISTDYFGTTIDMRSPMNITIEWLAFLTAFLILLWTGDMAKFFRPLSSNLILVIPAYALLRELSPMLLGIPSSLPVWLILPSLTYLVFFTMAILFGIRAVTSRLLEP